MKEWAFECVWNKLTEDTNVCDGTESERHWCMGRQLVSGQIKVTTGSVQCLDLYATTEGFRDKKAEKEDRRHSQGCVSKAIQKPELQCECLFSCMQWESLKKGAGDDKYSINSHFCSMNCIPAIW